MINPKLLEVLSPAGNIRMLEAAVKSGSDAVYLGAKDFSARRNADNFSDDELKDAVAYCHIRGVKVYLTLNILIKDSEMGQAFSLAQTAYNIGVDGIIIQDLGLASVIHKMLPDFPLHASTQMSIHSPAALSLLKNLGFSRVVVAREMSFNELKMLCAEAKKLDMEVEVFVHGALCMSVSGQCLMSAFLGSRSGNRGLCAGPCRLPFKVSGGTGFDLSLKDLSLIPYISSLIEIGVTSFKIEGRMKRPEYVAAATYAVRKAIDEGSTPLSILDTLQNVFSRSGFTSDYYENKLGREMFGIRTKEDVKAASEAFPILHQLYRGERHSVGIKAHITIKKDLPLTISLTDGINEVISKGVVPPSAINSPVTEDSIKKSVDKFGSTPYFLSNISVDIDDGLFVSPGQLNEVRRNASDLLNAERSKVTRVKKNEIYLPTPMVRKSSIKNIYARFEDSAQIPDDISGIDGIIFPLEKNFNIENNKIPLIVDIPRGISDETILRNRLKNFKDKGFKSALCGNLSAIVIAKEEGFTVLGDTGLNTYNTESLNVLYSLGITKAILSSEIKLSDASKIYSSAQKGIISYGNIPLMLFRNCPLKNGRECKDCDKKGVITDRTSTDFRIRCRMGYSELLNSVPIWLADRQKEFTNIDFQVLYFTDETSIKTKEIIKSYNNSDKPSGKYTRGLYYRGTL